MKTLYSSIQEVMIEENVAKQLEQVLTGYDDLSYETEYEYSYGRRADLMIMQNGKPWIPIEVKNKLTDPKDPAWERGVKQIEKGCNALNLRFGVLTDSEKFILYDLWADTPEPIIQATDISKVISYVIGKKYAVRDEEGYKKLLIGTINRTFHDIPLTTSDIIVEIGNNTIKLTEEKELQLFDSLFPKCGENRICRYTSLRSIFAILDNESYRMCATEGMNDVEDGMFLWNKLYDEKQKEAYLSPNRESVYIMSCSPKEKMDDLTMWRLYGCDAKGVCLAFNVGEHVNENGFYLRQVRYDNDIIKKLSEITKYNVDNSHFPTFIFNFWELWGAFVKSEEYKVEEEIRLAFIYRKDVARKSDNKKTWMMTDSNSIICDFVDFKEVVAPFPLRLSRILLGPYSPEKTLNKQQLLKMIKTTKIFSDYNIEVGESSIKNYRPMK